MSQLIAHLSYFLKSSKPHHVTVGFLFIILIGTNGHLYAQQSRMESDQTQKADKETIAEMLAQNKELIDIQRQAQLAQHAQWQESLLQLSSLESRVVNSDSLLQNQIYELKAEQSTLNSVLKLNAETNAAILQKLNSLDRKLSNIDN